MPSPLSTPEDGSIFGDEDPASIRDRLAAIVRSAHEAIYSKDTNGIVTSWNAAAERLYGYPESEIVGRSIALIVPTELAGEEREVLGHIEAGKEIDQFETRRLTKDGRIIEVSISASPIHNSNGDLVGVSVIARDISEQKKNEGIAERLAAIVASSDDAIYSKDARAIVDTWNHGAERLYGYTPEEAIGRHVSFIVPLHRKGEETDILNRILRGERVEHFDTERVTKAGDIVEVSLTVSPIHDSSGAVIGASVIGRDLSERRHLEALQRSVDRTEFMARAAHELRNPITALTGLAKVLADENDISDEMRDRVMDSLKRQSVHLEHLLRDLLDLTYVESGRYEISLEPVPVKEVIHDALELAPCPEDKRVQVELDSELTVEADRMRLGQVLVNLLSNAYKYGGECVTLSAQGTRDRVRLEVTDDGPGLPDKVRESIFEPFVRGHSGVTGTGLGLSIVARLVEAQGGTISVADREDGTHFVIDLRRSPSPVDSD